MLVTFVDAMTALGLAGSVMLGFRRRLTGELGPLLVSAAALAAGLAAGPWLAAQLRGLSRFRAPAAAPAIAFAVAAGVGLTLVATVVSLVHRRARPSHLARRTDVLGGFALGIVRGVVQALLIFALLNLAPSGYLNYTCGDRSVAGRFALAIVPGLDSTARHNRAAAYARQAAGDATRNPDQLSAGVQSVRQSKRRADWERVIDDKR